MNPLIIFRLLKTDVLNAYKQHYVYFEGNWKSFSSQDILNLIDLIEQTSKQRISEKWIYTHLKPDENLKLPRKDMLDILSQFAGFSNWDEYIFKHKEVSVSAKELAQRKLFRGVILVLAAIVIGFFTYLYSKNSGETIIVKNAFTDEPISHDEIKAFVVEDDVETPIKVSELQTKVSSTEKTEVILKSPYYKNKSVVIRKDQSEITMQPDDYAMMLKAFMKSDIKDWQTRKKQLQKMLSDDAEIIVILRDNLGFEYFNKEEFSEKLIVPTASLKKMKVIEIRHNDQDEINFIRIIQE